MTIYALSTANGISGFPGAYAKGNYYITTERPDALTDSYWNNNSTAELTSTAAQTVFDFDVDAVTGDNGLLRTDAGSPNTLNVYVNSGTGWILKTLDTVLVILDKRPSFVGPTSMIEILLINSSFLPSATTNETL